MRCFLLRPFHYVIGLVLLIGFFTFSEGVQTITLPKASAWAPIPQNQVISEAAPQMLALPEPENHLDFSLQQRWVKQGNTTRLTISHSTRPIDPDNYTLQVGNKRFPIYEVQTGKAMAIIPIDPLQEPSVLPLTVTEKSTGKLIYRDELHSTSANYKKQYITVSKKTAGLEPAPGELAAIGQFKRTSTTTRRWWQPFVSPVPDCMNSPFGVQRIVNGEFTGNYHKGIDQRSPQGRPIKAIAGGTVVLARNYRLHGGTVGLDHGQGLTSIYIHMSKLGVQEGQVVGKGQIIGNVGSTGFASGPHLHWGLYVHGIPVDPTPWVDLPSC